MALKPEFAGPETNDLTKTDKVSYFNQRGGSSAIMSNSKKQKELDALAAGEEIEVVELAYTAGTGGANAAYGANTYNGVSDNGMGGAIKVQVTVMNGEIIDIKVTEHKETVGIGDVALDKLVAEAKEKKSAEIDAVSGATITSQAFVEALSKALSKIE